MASSRGRYWPGGVRGRAALILSVTLGLLWTLSIGSAQTVKVTGERKLISRVSVIYPQIARRMGLKGRVKVSATVAPNGKVLKTELIGGSPVFIPYAMDAIALMKWEPAAEETKEIVEIEFTGSLRR